MDVRTAELIALRKAAVEQVAGDKTPSPRGVALQHALGPWASGAPPAEGLSTVAFPPPRRSPAGPHALAALRCVSDLCL